MSGMSSLGLSEQSPKGPSAETTREATENALEDVLMANGLNIPEQTRQGV